MQAGLATRIAALVPVKPLSLSKSRLSSELSASKRAQLIHDTLRRTVLTLLSVNGICDVYLVTRDKRVIEWARDWRCRVIADDATELNAALESARARMTQSNKYDALIVTSADMGWLAAEDVQACVSLARDSHCITIAPDRHRRGTNLLLLRPPTALSFCFGESSFARFCEQAQAKALACHIYSALTTSLDVDTATDLRLYDRAIFVM